MDSNVATEAVADHIPALIGLAKLARPAYNGEDMGPIWQALTSRFSEDQSDDKALLDMCGALMDMCVVDQLRGNPERGLTFQSQALSACRRYHVPARAPRARLRLLGFVMAGKFDVNIPIEFLIEDSDIALDLVYIVPGAPLPAIPEHDLAFVLVCDSEAARPILAELDTLVADWPKPVLNEPHLVAEIGRERLFDLLATIEGIEITATRSVSRDEMQQIGQNLLCIGDLLSGGAFPLIVRPHDSHAGHGLARIDSQEQIYSYLADNPESGFFLSRFMDYRSPDGLYRKYRVAVIDGEAFPCHMAISDHWMIHFVNAGMVESAEKRSEEERFMNRFREEFGQRHARAIEQMAEASGLEYFGIDCAEMPDGRLLVFEADTAMVVHNLDQPNIFPYKGAHMLALFSAFRAMLYRYGGVSSSGSMQNVA